MTCKHCGQPVQRCRDRQCRFYDCRGWQHACDHQHTCDDMEHSADPEVAT